MSTTQETEMTELAYRSTDGVAVTLIWNRPDDSLKVTVDDARTGRSFELTPPRERALDVFYHPYAYAA